VVRICCTARCTKFFHVSVYIIRDALRSEQKDMKRVMTGYILAVYQGYGKVEETSNVT